MSFIRSSFIPKSTLVLEQSSLVRRPSRKVPSVQQGLPFYLCRPLGIHGSKIYCASSHNITVRPTLLSKPLRFSRANAQQPYALARCGCIEASKRRSCSFGVKLCQLDRLYGILTIPISETSRQHDGGTLRGQKTPQPQSRSSHAVGHSDRPYHQHPPSLRQPSSY